MENNNLVFAKCNAVNELNKVEGFNPLDYVTSSKNERSGEEFINLDTKYRQLWFRLCYPQGKVTKKILRLTDQVAAVEAKVYIDRNDPEESYIASGVAQRFYDPNKDFGMYYLESAETIAEGRALGKAGFGIQFCDFDGQKDDIMPDTGVKMPNGNSSVATKQTDKPKDKVETVMANTNTDAGQKKTTDTPVQSAKANTDSSGELPFDVPNDVQADKKNGGSQNESANLMNQMSLGDVASDNKKSGAAEVINSEKQSLNTEMALAVDNQADNEVASYDASTPVDEILKVMTVEDAENVVIPLGFNKGKTLRQVSLANARQLRWFFESYDGSNNILKAGAKLLFDRSQQQKAS